MTVPIEELGTIIIAHPQCRITLSAIAKLAEGNVPVIYMRIQRTLKGLQRKPLLQYRPHPSRW